MEKKESCLEQHNRKCANLVMFGEIASTALSRVTILLLFYLVQNWKERHHIGRIKEI